MATAISDLLLRQFSGFLSSRIGLHFPRERWPDMLRGLERAAPELGLAGAGACMQWLLASPQNRRQAEILASHLTVGETYFYREPAFFAALEDEVLPALIAARRAAGRLQLRIWSAGCCTGEEPYSVAVLLSRLLPDLEQWNITLLATDINPHFLAKAIRGEYREWSFRGAPAWFREGYFTPFGAGTYVLAPQVRRLASFDYLNLVDDVYPALVNNTNAMDIVLCRNVLMYFEADSMRAVLDKFRRALTDDGWLVVSSTEANTTMFSGFVPVSFRGAFLYRKGEIPAALRPTMPAMQMMLAEAYAVPAWAELAVPPAPTLADRGTEQAAVLATTTPLPLARTQPAAPPAAVAGAAAYRQALACYAQGDYAMAADVLAAAAPDDVPALVLAARACANQGKLDEACRWCEAAVAADKLNPGLRYLLASVLAEQGQGAAAAASLKQALYLNQDFALAHFALGNLCRRLGQGATAARHFANARELLAAHPPDAPLPDAEGLTAGRLLDIIDSGECIA
ncbi:MAG: protein-glutamate O-methyltransferase CheR [Sulfuritalea sp.]|nr:protein-glutamate O-methyltransferase CheR [Sulfuritalea sp.]